MKHQFHYRYDISINDFKIYSPAMSNKKLIEYIKCNAVKLKR